MALHPRGGTYEGAVEEFLSGVPLPVTDGVVGNDGALYFATGGRRLDSYLIRVTYTGEASLAAAGAPRPRVQQELRRSLEAHHGRQDARAIQEAWPHLCHPDRFVRFAARVAVEHQPVKSWQGRALQEADPVRRLHAVVALTRSAEAGLSQGAYQALISIDETLLSRAEQLDLLHALAWCTYGWGRQRARCARPS